MPHTAIHCPLFHSSFLLSLSLLADFAGLPYRSRRLLAYLFVSFLQSLHYKALLYRIVYHTVTRRCLLVSHPLSPTLQFLHDPARSDSNQLSSSIAANASLSPSIHLSILYLIDPSITLPSSSPPLPSLTLNAFASKPFLKIWGILSSSPSSLPSYHSIRYRTFPTIFL
ncbi:hypothetical protein F5877DRAFT_81521 [Lentinula edodes]|nr:hypothetical protein F5877DRAFT_81521 [Lentinula edodes]